MEHIQAKDIKPNRRKCKLSSGVNWQGLLKKKVPSMGWVYTVKSRFYVSEGTI